MSNQPSNRAFQPGDRIIFEGLYIGHLVNAEVEREWTMNDGTVIEMTMWLISWEDGADDGGVRHPENKIVHANGGRDSARRISIQFADLKAKAEKFIVAYEEMLRIDQGIGGLAIERPDLMPDFDAWWEASERQHADTVISIINTLEGKPHGD